MVDQIFKRKIENNNKINENLNNDEFDVTWGGKKARYIYNYKLQPFNDDSVYDSEDTESVCSIQSKITMEVVSEKELLTTSSCDSNCDCQDYSTSIYSEYELGSSPSSLSCKEIYGSISTDSFTDNCMDIANIKKLDETLLNSDNVNASDDTDIKINIPKTKLPPPACFQICVQCKKENSNPYYQYCHTCFRYRMEFFVNRPHPKSKIFKRLRVSSNKEEKKEDVLPTSSPDCGKTISHDTSISCSHQSSLIGLSSMHLSQEEHIKSSRINTLANKYDLCNICFRMPKNGLFHHGKFSHNYCCYPCTKKLWSKSNKCPLCNTKIKSISKMIIG